MVRNLAQAKTVDLLLAYPLNDTTKTTSNELLSMIDCTGTTN